MLKTATPCFLGNTDCGKKKKKKLAPATSIQTLRSTDCQLWHPPAIVCTALFNKFLVTPLFLPTPLHRRRTRKKISRECSSPLRLNSRSQQSRSQSFPERRQRSPVDALCLRLLSAFVPCPPPQAGYRFTGARRKISIFPKPVRFSQSDPLPLSLL